MPEPHCQARRSNGRSCGEPATIADQQLGGMVCVDHATDKGGLHERFDELDLHELPSDPDERDRVLDEQDPIEYRLGELDARTGP